MYRIYEREQHSFIKFPSIPTQSQQEINDIFMAQLGSLLQRQICLMWEISWEVRRARLIFGNKSQPFIRCSNQFWAKESLILCQILLIHRLELKELCGINRIFFTNCRCHKIIKWVLCFLWHVINQSSVIDSIIEQMPVIIHEIIPGGDVYPITTCLENHGLIILFNN